MAKRQSRLMFVVKLLLPQLLIVFQGPDGEKIEYRVWNPFRSKLAAAILGGVENIWMGPGAKVLYLGAASGTTVSHVSDIVGPVSSDMPLALDCFLLFVHRTVLCML